MHYFVTCIKKTGEITSHFRSSSNQILPLPPSPDSENIEVTDNEHIEILHAINPHTARLRGTVYAGKIRTLKFEPIFRGRIELSCDLPDRDGDGLPEIPADGKTIARIKATLRGADNNVLSTESLAIRFQVTRGSLSHRQTKTEKGAAETELRSIAETVRIRVISTAENFERGILDIEVIPVEEYRALVESRSTKAN